MPMRLMPVGYLLKDATPEELGQAIDVAISGDAGLCPRTSSGLCSETGWNQGSWTTS